MALSTYVSREAEGRGSTKPLLFFTNMIYIIPGLGEKKYKLPKYVYYLHLTIDDVFNLPKLPKDSVLIGFSIGAVLAYLIAYKSPIKKLILCSPPPIVQRYKQPKGHIFVLNGNREHTHMKKYAKQMAKKLRAEYLEVKGDHHLKGNYLKRVLAIAND